MIAATAPAWAVWLCVGLGCANVVVWTAFVIGARALVRRYKAVLSPLLSMLAPPATSDDQPAPAKREVVDAEFSDYSS